MKGDFTRSTFDRRRHFSGVRMQQGRVQLDADWNEHVDLTTYRIETEAADTLGGCGAPLHADGFRLAAAAADLTADEAARPGNATPPPLEAGDVYLTAGRMYVDGVLCENERIVPFTAQPDRPNPALPDGGAHLAVLDVWTRHLTALDLPPDPVFSDIREVALGGPDTATRTRTVWQVRLLPLGDGDDAQCLGEVEAWDDLIAPPTGQIAARAEEGTTAGDPCIVTPGGGYRRLENQLYRVEVYAGGERNDTVFAWSRDNGTVAARWTGETPVSPDELQVTVNTLGRDEVLRFAPGQWAELTDDNHQLEGRPGLLAPILRAEDDVLTLDLTAALGTETSLADYPTNPRVRRWDGVVANPTNANWRALEGGVQVQFFAGTYRSGDYWQVPARTATADVAWPEEGGTPLRQSPHGIRHHYCRLGFVTVDAAGAVSVTDCRPLFPPVAELTSLFYVSGDGQESAPGDDVLPHPLQVGVANGRWPVAGATVRFRVDSGGGTIGGASEIEVTTVGDGVASASWELGSADALQRVEATLLDAAGAAIHLPIRFTARYGAEGREPGFHVVRIRAGNGALLNDSLVTVSRLVAGIEIECDADPAPLAVRDKPVCFVTLHLPFPFTRSEVDRWGDDLVATQPIRLDGDALVDDNEIFWRASDRARDWLRSQLFGVLAENGYTGPILAYLTVKGDFIWEAQRPDRYLDGDVRGRLRDDNRTDAVLPSGDGRRGGDLSLWFWLARDEGNPDIAAEPDTLFFGVVTVGGAVIESFALLNEGDAPLVVNAFGVPGPSFTVLDAGPLTVPPGGSATVRVRFAPPTAGPFNGPLVVESNDPDEPTLQVLLSGRGLAVQNDPARVQIIHNAVGVGPIDVYVGERRILNDFAVRRATPFFSQDAGRQRLAFAGPNSTSPDDAAFVLDVDLEAGQAYVIVTCGNGDTFTAVVLEDARETSESPSAVALRPFHGLLPFDALTIGIFNEQIRVALCEGADGYTVVPPAATPISLTFGGEPPVDFRFDLRPHGGSAIILLTSGRVGDEANPPAVFGFDGNGQRIDPIRRATGGGLVILPREPVTGGNDPLLDVPSEARREVTAVRGIGPALAERLDERGVRRVGQIVAMEPDQLAGILGVNPDRASEMIRAAERLLGGLE